MPQHSLHPVIYILLMWITIISIIQVVFISIYFATGQNTQSMGRRTAEPGGTSDPSFWSTPLPRNSKSLNNTMISFQATPVGSAIKWISPFPEQKLISYSDEKLQIRADGLYFLSLQVTLDDTQDCVISEHIVKLNVNDKVLLEGRIDLKTNSSGQLSKVKGLSSGSYLEVTIHPPTSCINKSDIVTHLDIIFMKV